MSVVESKRVHQPESVATARSPSALQFDTLFLGRKPLPGTLSRKILGLLSLDEWSSLLAVSTPYRSMMISFFKTVRLLQVRLLGGRLHTADAPAATELCRHAMGLQTIVLGFAHMAGFQTDPTTDEFL